jgi:methanogenic corrinoid protein MtbC1
MIRWCAYCQRHQGEAEPYDDYSVTHTICEDCTARGAYMSREPASLAAIRDFLARVADAAGPEASAEQLVSEGMALGLDPVDLLLGIVQPVLRQIGERWASGEATIAEEHRVSATCGLLIQRIADADPNAAALRQAPRPEVLLLAAANNRHTLGIQLLEALLIRQYISTFTIYPGPTVDEIVALARKLRPRVAAISCALPEQLGSAQLAAERLAELPHAERPLVVVGGLGLRDRRTSGASTQPVLSRDPRVLIDLVLQARAASEGRAAREFTRPRVH